MAVSSIKLNNGVLMPEVGLGTWKAHEQGTLRETVKAALGMGYRHIDCAKIYDNQREIGAALKEAGVPRKDLFITSKIFDNRHRPELVAGALDEILDELQLEYLDLLLVHWPFAVRPDYSHGDYTAKDLDDVPIMDTWRAMEVLIGTGKVRAIGVSNFNRSILQRMLPQCRVRPAVNQIEVHPYNPEHELVGYCQANDIAVTGYCPLGGGQVDVLGDSTIQRIAAAHGCSPAQVLISWQVARGIVVIPKSNNVSRLKQNLQTVTLTLDEMQAIGQITTRQRKVDPSHATPELRWVFHEDEAKCPLI
ncbi:hypothetical protein LPJ61_000035 [Coemansia biformis]|uniref:NADP-dependent oxidoreductase domain-containing protein n=1 Tax=Coemansia biformis TaxID=1286918 RepID=A0A9W7YCC3_9FUNG|nr:hypothetical protein LPJ61_000035 [Coemansia biformis]